MLPLRWNPRPARASNNARLPDDRDYRVKDMLKRSWLICTLVVIAGTTVVGAPEEPDRPRPGIWRAHPALKKAFDSELAALPAYLRKLEGEAFAANYGKLAEQARFGDAEQRDRALKAIGALREETGIPILAAAIRDREPGSGDGLQATMMLATWIHDAYHADGRKPPASFRPLLALFVRTLVEAGDEPNVRAYCHQAVGCLAEPRWLPLVKDLADSRHPAVTHWSSWAVGQIEARCRSRRADPLMKASYVVPAAEVVSMRQAIRRILATEGGPPAGQDVWYSEGIAHFDHWIPLPGTPQRDRPDRPEHWEWRYRDGRVTEARLVTGGKGERKYRVWYDEACRPVLCLNEGPDVAARYIWGDYDKNGLLRRITRLTDDFEVFTVTRFVNEGIYDATTTYAYDTKGKPYFRTRSAPEGLYVLDRGSSTEKRVNSGSRRWWLRRLERYGLASIYPIPRQPYDPRNVRLVIGELTVDPAIVERQCTGSLVVRNVGPSYPDPADVVGPYYMLQIHDAAGKLIFRAGGSWGGPMEAGAEQKLTFDTHSNTLPGAGGRAFLLPKVGPHTLRVTLHPGQLKKTLDEKTVPLTVALRPTPDRLTDTDP